MPPRAVELHPQAIEDIRGARDWYASRNELAAAGFFSEVEYGLKRIAELPDAWPAYLHGTRRFLLRRYPYSLVYRVKPSMIEVIAVAHAKRRPGFWRDR
jgi:toxin ParE1/3/4